MTPDRLHRSADVRDVLAARRGSHGRAMVVFVRPAPDPAAAPRAAVIASRKVGGAVQRNRAKRRLRAALGAVAVPGGTDVVVVARPGATAVGYEALVAELQRLLRRAGEARR